MRRILKFIIVICVFAFGVQAMEKLDKSEEEKLWMELDVACLKLSPHVKSTIQDIDWTMACEKHRNYINTKCKNTIENTPLYLMNLDSA